MGACGSSKQIMPGDVTKSADQSLWKPDKLTFEMVKKAFPEFAKDLKSIRMGYPTYRCASKTTEIS